MTDPAGTLLPDTKARHVNAHAERQMTCLTITIAIQNTITVARNSRLADRGSPCDNSIVQGPIWWCCLSSYEREDAASGSPALTALPARWQASGSVEHVTVKAGVPTADNRNLSRVMMLRTPIRIVHSEPGTISDLRELISVFLCRPTF